MSQVPMLLMAVSTLVPLVLAVLYIRHIVTEGVSGGRAAAAAALLLVTLVGVGVVVWDVLMPGAAIAEAQLNAGESIVAELPNAASSVLVRGELPTTAAGQAIEGDFTVSVEGADGQHFRFDGRLSKHYATSRSGRRGHSQTLVANLEERFDLPALVAHEEATIKVLKKADTIQGPLSVEVIPAPPESHTVAEAGLVLLVAGALLDTRSTRRKTYFTPVLGTLVAYAVLYCHNVVPHGTYRPVVGAAMAAVPLGLIGGAALRVLALKLLGRRASEGEGDTAAAPA